MSRLGNNQLFNSEAFDAEKERAALGIEPQNAESGKRKGRPRKDGLVRDGSVQDGLTEEWTRATFIVRRDLLDKLKDYAYTERVTLKEALENALDNFLKDKDNLLPHK